MSDKDLDSQVLERSVEHFEASRHAFYRDLKFAIPLILLFYGLVFSRYLSVSAKQKEQAATVVELSATRTALRTVEERIAALIKFLEQGENEFQRTLSNFPIDLRAEFQKLDETLLRFRQSDFPAQPSPERRSLQLQTQQAPPSESLAGETLQLVNSPFFAGMQRSNLVQLHKLALDDANFAKLVEWIAETNIVAPAYERLNSAWETSVVQPFSKQRSEILGSTNEFSLLENVRIDARAMITNVNDSWTTLMKQRFVPPKRAAWWRTVDEKMVTGRAMRGDVEQITSELSKTLVPAHSFLAGSTVRLQNLLDEAIAKQGELKRQLDELQAELESLQGQLKEFASAIPYIALPLRDTVLFFPSVAALALALFLFRYATLRRRAMSLAAVYSQQGATQRTVLMAFPEVAPTLTWIVCAVAAGLAATVLIFTSTRQLLTHPILAADFPRSLHVASLIIVGFATVLLLGSFKTARAKMGESDHKGPSENIATPPAASAPSPALPLRSR